MSNRPSDKLKELKRLLSELEYNISCVLADLEEKQKEAQVLKEEIAKKTADYQFNPSTASFEVKTDGD